MRILIVAATELEVAALRPRLGTNVEVLVTGVGMVATAAWCSRALSRERYDLALNLGVCGSFDRSLPPGTVVHVVNDRIAELGAEDGEAFLTLDQLKLPAESQVDNAAPPAIDALRALPAVSAITVNTVHGNERSIAAVVERFRPQVESMEGAAFMYACLIHGVVFAQVRAVSNIVEKRNRAGWKSAEAIAHLSETALSILEHA
jgi:futalosine hydrolase